MKAPDNNWKMLLSTLFNILPSAFYSQDAYQTLFLGQPEDEEASSQVKLKDQEP